VRRRAQKSSSRKISIKQRNKGKEQGKIKREHGAKAEKSGASAARKQKNRAQARRESRKVGHERGESRKIGRKRANEGLNQAPQ
jgi:hypothetical protein